MHTHFFQKWPAKKLMPSFDAIPTFSSDAVIVPFNAFYHSFYSPEKLQIGMCMLLNKDQFCHYYG